MSDDSSRPVRRPLASPAAHQAAPAPEPSVERLLPAERLLALPPATPAVRPEAGARRRLGAGGLSYTAADGGE